MLLVHCLRSHGLQNPTKSNRVVLFRALQCLNPMKKTLHQNYNNNQSRAIWVLPAAQGNRVVSMDCENTVQNDSR